MRAGSGQNAFIRMFELPAEWSPQQRFDFNIEQYRKYIRAIAALTAMWGTKSAFFIQPVPAIQKALTEQEKAAVGPLAYKDIYERMMIRVLDLTKENIAVYSLLDLFAEEHGTLYSDAIHLKIESDGESRGYRKMAEAMAQRISEVWGLQRICRLP